MPAPPRTTSSLGGGEVCAADVDAVVAAANDVAPHVAPEIQEERLARFMQKSAAISAVKLAAKVGRRMKVLVDIIDGNTAIARSEGDAPEIDGVVRISKGAKLPVGEFVDVEITGSSDHDLEAKVAKSN